MNHLREEYTFRYMYSVATDSLNHQKLGEMIIVVSENYKQSFWIKYPKKRRIRNKWIQRGYNIIDYAWAEYSMSGTWFVHPKIYQLLKQQNNITDSRIQNFMKALESSIGKRRVTRQELGNATHSPAFQ